MTAFKTHFEQARLLLATAAGGREKQRVSEKRNVSHTESKTPSVQVCMHLSRLCQSPPAAPRGAHAASSHAAEVMETYVKPRIKRALRHAVLAACPPVPLSSDLGAPPADAAWLNQVYGAGTLLSAAFILDDNLHVHLLALTPAPQPTMPHRKVCALACSLSRALPDSALFHVYRPRLAHSKEKKKERRRDLYNAVGLKPLVLSHTLLSIDGEVRPRMCR